MSLRKVSRDDLVEGQEVMLRFGDRWISIVVGVVESLWCHDGKKMLVILTDNGIRFSAEVADIVTAEVAS